MPKHHNLHHSLLFGNPHHQSTHSINESVAALQRKSDLAHVGDASPAKHSPKRPSFTMHAILHPHKDKAQSKHNESTEQEERRHKRSSLTGGLRSSSKPKDGHAAMSPRLAPVSPGKFDIIIESPPLIFYGPTATSTGALLSGRLKLTVLEPSGQVKINKLTMTLNAAIYTKKPVSKDCPNCSKRINDLNTWRLLTEPKTFQKDQDNQFPFSFLLPGHLPATTLSALGTINYCLDAKATTSSGEEITVLHPLKIERAVPPGLDKSSVRIFPPTNLTGRVIMPPVIHPIGTFPLQMVLSGVVDKRADTQTRWRLRKVLWRIDELTKMVSAPCSRHGHKVGGDGKALQHQDERVVGSDELKGGWKTDFDTQGGEISLEFDASLHTYKKPICDMDSPAGLEVKHNLVIELIIAEEFCPNRNTSLITPTGAARVLRMQFSLHVSQRAGMGISWDEEMPPVYDDVPSSPPMYGNLNRSRTDAAFGGGFMEDYHGPELDYVDIERLHSDNPADPPVYRERDPTEYAGIMEAMMRERSERPPPPPSAPGTPSASAAVLPSPGLHPSLSPRFRARAGTSDSTHSHHSSQGLAHLRRHRFTEDDFEIEPLEERMRASRLDGDENENEGERLEDVGEGETA